jgi:hypothetical protein
MHANKSDNMSQILVRGVFVCCSQLLMAMRVRAQDGKGLIPLLWRCAAAAHECNTVACGWYLAAMHEQMMCARGLDIPMQPWLRLCLALPVKYECRSSASWKGELQPC